MREPTSVSIQDRLYPELTCFGCGPANPRGLRLRSYEQGGLIVAEFLPRPEHENGMGFVCGGIVATVLDCHSAAAVMVEAAHRGWVPERGASVPYVTSGLDLSYLRPMPIDETAHLRAHVLEADDDRMLVDVELVWEGKVRSRATALWKAWHPRG